MDSVCVILSAYNQTNFLREQLDSIFAQKDIDLHIAVRDDGSSCEDTIKILDEYNEKYHFDVYEKGENKGVISSFLRILKLANEYFSKKNQNIYYAFCDCDDIWFENKLSESTKCLKEAEKQMPHKPICYSCSDIRLIDGKEVKNKNSSRALKNKKIYKNGHAPKIWHYLS